MLEHVWLPIMKIPVYNNILVSLAEAKTENDDWFPSKILYRRAHAMVYSSQQFLCRRFKLPLNQSTGNVTYYKGYTLLTIILSMKLLNGCLMYVHGSAVVWGSVRFRVFFLFYRKQVKNALTHGTYASIKLHFNGPILIWCWRHGVHYSSLPSLIS